MRSIINVFGRIILFSLLFTSIGLFSQVPKGFNYQAVLRNANGSVKVNEAVALKLLILKGTADGEVVFQENHDITTNGQGLITVIVGSQNAESFAGIDWSLGVYFLKVSVDGTEMGTTQLLSVPYALYAETSGTSTAGPKGESAYDLWKENKGTEATMDEFIESLVGPQGIPGKSAFEIWKEDYPEGTYDDYMDSIRGPQGAKGDTGVAGKSAFELWREANSTEGTFADFMDSLRGPQGLQGEKGEASGEYINDTIVDADSLWSSSKISKELGTKVDTLNVAKYETDPMFAGSLASKITEADTTRWALSSANSGVTKEYVDNLFLNLSTADRLIALGYTEADLYTHNHSAFDIYKAGGDLTKLIDVIQNPLELQQNGVGIKTLKNAGVTDGQLIDKGFKGTLTDIDGNEYGWVRIGNQIWMAENLRVTKYPDGTSIDYVDHSQWPNVPYSGAAYGAIFDDAQYASFVGYMYTWPAVTRKDTVTPKAHPKVQGICPDGWHVPTDWEWYTLGRYVDSIGGYLPGPDLAVDSVWNASAVENTVGYNLDNNNELEFNTYPAGFRYRGGGDDYYKKASVWWCSDGSTSSSAAIALLNAEELSLTRSAMELMRGAYVRCLKDE